MQPSAQPDCKACPLGERPTFFDRDEHPWVKVPSEFNRGAEIAIVAEAPGEQEEEWLAPLKGPSGMLLMDALRAAGYRRESFALINVASCRWPTNKRDQFIGRIDRLNAKARKEAVKAGSLPVLVPTPEESCRPRFWSELQRFDNIIALGAVAAKAILGPDSSIMEIRGRPFDCMWTGDGSLIQVRDGMILSDAFTRPARVLPTVHPAFILHGAARWKGPLFADIAKALRWFSTGLQWVPPEVLYQPNPQQLEEFLFKWAPKHAQHLTGDFETGFEVIGDETPEQARWRALEPRFARPDPSDKTIRCLALGTDRKVLVIGFLSIDGQTRLYRWDVERAIRALLKRFFDNPPIPISGHNFIQFDDLLVKYGLGAKVPEDKIIDTGPMHRLEQSEFPHSLSFVASMHTDAPDWKGDHTATQARTDFALHKYCANDVAVDHAVVEPLYRSAYDRNQQQLITIDHKIAHFCRDLHDVGVHIDQAAVAAHDIRTTAEMDKWRSLCCSLTGKKDFNPGAHEQVQTLLYEDLKLPIMDIGEKGRLTTLGNPSSADVWLRDMLLVRDGRVSPHAKKIIKAIRRYRRFQKQRGTFVWPSRPMGWSPTGKIVDARGGCWPDGRLRAHWSGWSVVTGRLSSSDPNLMAWPAALSDIVVPAPGNVFVGADLNQAEVRVVASTACIVALLKEFAKGEAGDPHEMVGIILFGEEYLNAPGGKKEKGTVKYRFRQCAKTFGLACLYGSTSGTVYAVITKEEDKDTGELMFPDFDEAKVSLLHERLLTALPELEDWWSRLSMQWQLQGCVASLIHGRRRDGLDGDDPGLFASMVAQSTIGDVVNDITIELREGPIPMNAWGPGTGIVLQKHDSLVVECPESKGLEVAALLEKTCTRRYDALPNIELTTEVSIGKSWKEV